MAVTQSTVEKSVIQILNAGEQNASGSPVYSAVIQDDRRVAGHVTDAATQAGERILLAICETEGNGHRPNFMALSGSIAHGAVLPEHIGPIGTVQIQPYAGAEFIAGLPADVDDIESWRANVSSLYDTVAHNASGSSLAGRYAVLGNELFYTGHDAKIYLANFTRADVATKVPDAYEATWVRLTVGLLAKEGDTPGLIQMYAQAGENDLAAIRSGAMITPILEQAQRAA